MFFDAQRRFGTSDFSYARSIAAQYGNNGNAFRVPQRPSHLEVENAIKFRAEERAEYEQMKKRLAVAELNNQHLTKHFLATMDKNAPNNGGGASSDNNNSVSPILLPTNHAS